MPITFGPQTPTFIGPGFSLLVSSDQVQLPIQHGWEWIVLITDPTFQLGEQPVCSWGADGSIGSSSAVIENFKQELSVLEGYELHQGQQVRLQVQLKDPDRVVQDESDAIPITWDGAGQIYRWQLFSQSTTTGGYTQADRDAALTDANNNVETNQLALAINAATTAAVNIGTSVLQLPIGQILSSNFSDAFRLEDIGGGVTCDPIRVNLSRSSLYGVTVRVTQYPDDTVFRTPDGAWSFKDLAVLTITRGGDILARHGIHTTSHTLSPLPETPYPWLTNLGVPVQPSDYHAAVDWAEGVCGELLGLVLP